MEEVKKEKKAMTPREMRVALAENNKVEVVAESVNLKEEFRVFFAKKKEKLGLDKDLEKILWMHMRSSGHLEVGKFDEGFDHFFGIKK